MTVSRATLKDLLLRIDHYFHFPPAMPDPRMDQVLELLQQIITKETTLMANIQDVQAAVEAETTVQQSVIALLNGLAQQLRDAMANNDPAALQAVVDQISANTQRLSDAVTANTPAQP